MIYRESLFDCDVFTVIVLSVLNIINDCEISYSTARNEVQET